MVEGSVSLIYNVRYYLPKYVFAFSTLLQKKAVPRSSLSSFRSSLSNDRSLRRPWTVAFLFFSFALFSFFCRLYITLDAKRRKNCWILEAGWADLVRSFTSIALLLSRCRRSQTVITRARHPGRRNCKLNRRFNDLGKFREVSAIKIEKLFGQERSWRVTRVRDMGNRLRTITSDQTVYNNSSLSSRTRRIEIIEKFIICFAWFILKCT